MFSEIFIKIDCGFSSLISRVPFFKLFASIISDPSGRLGKYAPASGLLKYGVLIKIFPSTYIFSS